MIRVVSFIVGLLAMVGSQRKFDEQAACSFIVADTIETTIYLKFDSLGIPDSYNTRIFTPVCETERCYAIEIDFYWDLIGRFLGYDTIPGQGLTKLDHIPFTEADYNKLDAILANSNSPLASYSKEELVKNTRGSELDGFTGATIREIKETVINGAVYSCYTLWHIANGTVIDSLQKTTSWMFTKGLVRKLVDQHSQEINYFLLDNFSEEDFMTYLPEVLESIQQGQGYYAKNAIEKLSGGVFRERLVQDFFAETFGTLSYFAQVALLKKMQSIPLTASLKSTLQGQVTERDSYKNELIKTLLDDN